MEISQKKQKKGKRSMFSSPGKGLGKNILSVLLFFAVISVLYSAIFHPNKSTTEVTLSQVAEGIKKGEVTDITVRGDKLEIIQKGDIHAESKKEPGTALSQTLVNYGVTSEELGTVKIDIKKESGVGFILLNLLPILLPIVLLVVFFWIMSGQMKGGGAMKAFSFGQSKAKFIDPKNKKDRVTFADVAGNKEAKVELEEVVDFLKNPKKFLDIGAKIPKGVLLTGAPGTGKTLLARAVAGEAEVPFFHLSGSEFVEMFVGVGASRVRDLFDMAKKMSPAIIFIDEIDAVGRSRGAGWGGGNDEREQTLNQILVEMDGFEPTEKVVVMAATNRADVLDTALLRPGRFDRRVMLDLPDRDDREHILKIHARTKPFDESVNLRVVAERTPGFSGADLESVMNEAAIFAARENHKKVSQRHLLSSIEKVMIGPERRSHLHTEKEKKLVAYHEAGHAIVSSVLPYADPVHKVSIIARGHAGGYTLNLPLEEGKLPSKKEFMDDIAVLLGGYACERMVYDDITTGPSNDLQVATRIARDMVTRYGMSDAIGPIVLEASGRAMFGEAGPISEPSKNMSDIAADEVKRIVEAGLAKASEVLVQYRDALEAVVAELLKVETLEQDDYNKVIKKFGITPREREEKVV